MNVHILLLMAVCSFAGDGQIGREVGLTRHLADGDEFRLPTSQVLSHGQLIFNANWTDQEGGGRPLTKGTGRPLSDPSRSRSRLRSEARGGARCAILLGEELSLKLFGLAPRRLLRRRVWLPPKPRLGSRNRSPSAVRQSVSSIPRRQ